MPTSKPVQCAFVALVTFVVAVTIASLVLNVLVFLRYRDEHESKHKRRPVKLPIPQIQEHFADLKQDVILPAQPAEELPSYRKLQPSRHQAKSYKVKPLFPPKPAVLNIAPLYVNSTEYCPSYSESVSTPAWQKAASVLLNAIDTDKDPCEDFYSFSCGTYIRHAPIGASTFFEAQITVNTAIGKALELVDVNDARESSLTERITKAAVQSCKKFNSVYEEELLIDLSNWFGAIPFLNHTLERDFDVFEAAGSLEATRALGTLMEATVSVDSKNTSQNVLYISQPSLPFPRDWYLLPQYTDYLQLRVMLIHRILIQFALMVLDDPSPYEDMIGQAAENVAKLEREMALASWPDTEMRDFSQQYNAYNLTDLERAYPAIKWQGYLDGFLSPHSNESKIAAKKIVLTQPSYFGWLNSLVQSSSNKEKANTRATIVNYMITQILFEEADFFGPDARKIAIEANYVPYVQRRGHGTKRIGRRRSRRFDEEDDRTLPCVDLVMSLMPYGPGYVYLKSLPNRDEIAKDTEEQVKLITERFVNMTMSLEWMSMT